MSFEVVLDAIEADRPFSADRWWYDGPDPTNGYVDYLSKSAAYSNGLAVRPLSRIPGPSRASADPDLHLLYRPQYVAPSGNAIMKVETTPVLAAGVRGRKSVRISTNWKFNANSLLIMDAVAMPVGCGV